MYRRFAGGLRVVLVGVVVLGAPYSDGPPAAHTGGFGEPTCHRCHGDNPVNDVETVLELDLPDGYRADSVYGLTVRLRRPGMKAGGFQLSARTASGSRVGRQAGRLASPDGETRTVVLDSSSVAYASHTRAVIGDRSSGMTWTVSWTAPDVADPVVFHLAANAANGDDSEFGDHIATARFVVEPASAGSGPPSREREQDGGVR